MSRVLGAAGTVGTPMVALHHSAIPARMPEHRPVAGNALQDTNVDVVVADVRKPADSAKFLTGNTALFQ